MFILDFHLNITLVKIILQSRSWIQNDRFNDTFPLTLATPRGIRVTLNPKGGGKKALKVHRLL